MIPREAAAHGSAPDRGPGESIIYLGRVDDERRIVLVGGADRPPTGGCFRDRRPVPW
jgi:hypothetical protein